MNNMNRMRVFLVARALGGQVEGLGRSLTVGTVSFHFLAAGVNRIELDVEVGGNVDAFAGRAKGFGVAELRQALAIWEALVAANVFEGLEVFASACDSDKLAGKRERLFARLGFEAGRRQF